MTGLKTILAAGLLVAMTTSAQANDDGDIIHDGEVMAHDSEVYGPEKHEGAHASDYGYMNLGMEAIEFDQYTIFGRAGYAFTKNLSVEGQGALGILSKDATAVPVESVVVKDQVTTFLGIAGPATDVDITNTIVPLPGSTTPLTVGDLATGRFEQSVDYSFSGFVRGSLPVADKLSLFGRIGYHVTKMELNDQSSGGIEGAIEGYLASLNNDSLMITYDDIDLEYDIDRSTTRDGFAFGAGGEYMINDKNGIRADFTLLDFNNAKGSLDSYSVGYVRRF